MPTIFNPRWLLVLQLLCWSTTWTMSVVHQHRRQDRQRSSSARFVTANLPPRSAQCSPQPHMQSLQHCIQNMGNCMVNVLEPAP